MENIKKIYFVFFLFQISQLALGKTLEKQVLKLDYTGTFSKLLEERVKNNLLLDKVSALVKVETASNFDKIALAKKSLNLNLASSLNSKNNFLHIEKISIDLATPLNLDKNQKAQVLKIAQELAENIPLNITYQVIETSGQNKERAVLGGIQDYVEHLLAGLSLLLVLSLVSWGIQKKKAKSNLGKSHDKAQEFVFSQNLKSLEKFLREDNTLLSRYFSLPNFNPNGVRTLLTYLELKFEPEILLNSNQMSIIERDGVYLSKEEFRVWVESMVTSFSLMANTSNNKGIEYEEIEAA